MKFVGIATGIVIAALGVGQARAELVEKRLEVDPRGEVEVINVAGSVHISGWERAEVQVNGDLGRGVERLDVQRDGNRTLVKVVLTSGRWNSGEADLDIHVPRDSKLTTNTVSAAQSILDVRGAQRLQSVSGDIDTQTWDGEFQAKSVSGNINAKGQANKDKPPVGQVRVTTVSGNIAIDNLGNELELRTVTGDMDVHASNLSRAYIKTTNGDMHLTASIQREASIDAEAINGDMNFDFDGVIDAQFDIETFNGDIDNCFGPKPKTIHEHGPGTELRFKEGEGRAHVRVKTLNGGIGLCKK
jgi:DUF4097 and DUF4098 domain-containing protein YvlB